MNYKLFGEKIKQIRLKRGLTQEKLSELCSISSTYIGVLEGGHKKPSIETLVKISNVLDVSTDYLLSDSLKLSAESRVQELVAAAKNLSSKEMDMVIDITHAMVLHFQKNK